MKRKGFTLMELMVVIMIIGIIASFGIPMYRKSIETSRATDSLSIVNMLGNANKMNFLDTKNYTSGQIGDWCNGWGCPAGTNTSSCRLIGCSYISKQQWSNSKYLIYACNPLNGAGGGCCAGGVVACSDRVNEGTSYDNWGYRLYENGTCQPLNGAPSCPSF